MSANNCGESKLKRHKLFSAVTVFVLVIVLATSGCTAKSDNAVPGFELEKEITNYSEVSSKFADEMLKSLPKTSEVRRYSLFIQDSANVGYLKSDSEDNVNLFYDSFAEQLKDFDTQIIIFSDPDWAKKKIEKLYAGQDDLNLITNDFGNGNFFDKKTCKDSNSLYGYAMKLSKPLIVISTQCTSLKILEDEENAPIQLSIISHELAHVAQSKISENDHNCYLPNWFIEGQAQAISSIVTTYKGKNYQSQIRSDWFNYNPSGRLDDNENYVSPGSDKGDGGVYSDGSLAIEYLVARSGWEKMKKMMTLASGISGGKCGTLGKMSYFKESFRVVYNQEFQDFQNEVNKYLRWAIDNS